MDEVERVDVKRIVPFALLHAGCLCIFFVGWSWLAVGVAVALYLVRMFFVTGFYHRYFSHRSFKTSRAGQFIFAMLGNTAMQRGPLWWAAHHRHHHAHSDEGPDTHSPGLRGLLWAHIAWLTSSKNFHTDYRKVKDLMKFPELVFLNKHDLLVPLCYGASLWLTGSILGSAFPALHTSGGQLFVWGFFVSTVALMHGTFCINSLAHVVGKRRFATDDDSRNSLLLALMTLGEGWHNNHHRYEHAARQGFYWWEIDISYYVLKMMAALGLIWDLKGVPAHVYAEAAALRKSQPSLTVRREH